jgi:hypothetical protein
MIKRIPTRIKAADASLAVFVDEANYFEDATDAGELEVQSDG